ncbi:hypothetical protein HOO65_040555 [Ceratocystis lukuohia]|uniref:Uncharacterized protein n=3 Tax=Ceratocystis TaxID=5157 RepID=A0A0F8B262_CERFI|nr:hypothetical protein CFO_g2243 [Ceratocystis platani]PHH50791.1 hypothetical protein CFIMG_004428RA [Ceratocystis fimbriata CBS 114723]
MDEPMIRFSQKDPELCRHYAGFAAKLERQQFDVIYWLLFSFNLITLFTAARSYIKAQEALQRRVKGTKDYSRATSKYLYFCLFCLACSIVIVIMEVFTLLALQFCDGEVLMSLYWSTWTMMQVGSLVAICGIVVALLHIHRDRREPPWALALGTPILVVAGIWHFLQDVIVDNIRSLWTKAKASSKDEKAPGLPLSQVNTIRVSGPPTPEPSSPTTMAATIDDADIIGFTLAGGPIVRFSNAVPSHQWGNPELVAQTVGGRPLLFYGPQGLQINRRGDENV